MLREAAAAEVGALSGVRLPGREGVWTVTIRDGVIAGIERGGAGATADVLIPGFHDPHVHVLSMLREREAVRLPDDLRGRDALAAAVRQAARRSGAGWVRLRRLDHDEMLGGWLPDRDWLDAVEPDRPLRIQHRNLRLDVLNSAGLARCGAGGDGRVFGAGSALRDPTEAIDLERLAAKVSDELLAAGVTSLQDAGEANGDSELALLDALAVSGALRQRLWTMVSGRRLAAGRVRMPDRRRVRHAKLVALEAELDLDDLVEQARAARRAGLGVAIHAATEVELAAAIAVLDAVGLRRGDRIEHAFVASDAAIEAVAATGAAVVASPALVAEHGDAYLERHGEPSRLHRLASWLRAGVPLALASDAPVTRARPLAMLDAARRRRTRGGRPFGRAEALAAGAALRAATRTPAALVGARTLGRIVPGAPADLVVLRDGAVALTVLRGAVVYEAPT
ncbi:MAG TPA: amidohydrolase family protein [Solirubrobacter sp.]|nr:amidohydrolase family protein [Solirubrobacter sp.]